MFAQQGCRATPYEKIADAAQVHRFTGWRRPWRCTSRGTGSTTTPPWRAHAAEQGVGIGAINSNVFQDDDYMLGSVTNPDPAVPARRRSITCWSASTSWTPTGSRDLKLWFSDGTNYPGQDDIRARQDRLAEALAAVYERLGDDQRFLLEYKLFEPAFYVT